ncbi:hypothetical protein QTO01_11215 [Vibrio mytili]|uniref:hypothetical protein n=1 Tax=Vibrio mytili TaxID=50718 RepID=UPI002F40BAC2
MATPIQFPDELEPNGASWEYSHNTRSFESPFTRYSQVVEGQGARWLASFEYHNLTQVQQRLIRYIETLPKGTVFSVPAHGFQYGGDDTARNVAVAGAGQTGLQLDTTGWSINTRVLRQGDAVGIDGELKVMAADVVSNGSGEATLTFTTPMRKSPATGGVITFAPAIIHMRRTIGDSASFGLSQGSEYSGILTAISLGFEEAIY